MQQITATVGRGEVLTNGSETSIRFGPLVLNMTTRDAQALAADLVASAMIDRAIARVLEGDNVTAETIAEAGRLRAVLRAEFGGAHDDD